MEFGDRFNIVFAGQLVQGVSLEVAKQNLKQGFGLDQVRLDAFFTGNPMVFKKNVDAGEAMKIRAQLKKLGLLTSQEACGDLASKVTSGAAADITKKNTTFVSVPLSPAARDIVAPDWSVAAAGSDLEQIKVERPPVVVDVSTLSVAPLGENLLAATRTESKAPNIDISQFSIVKE
ncbi:MAG TPA: hypothetical protein VFV48_05450 [Pseudomonadales bacterium]|nr:hypothetical protein [Pseudomonadales bacterium]